MLRYLIGLETPIAGDGPIDGVATPTSRPGRPPFGVMFQSGALLGSMTVGENVALPLAGVDRPAARRGLRDRAREAAPGRACKAVEDKMPSELSGGMKKRAAIARAMALEPKLIFLDEPSAGLDPVSAAELDELIIALERGARADGGGGHARAREHLPDRASAASCSTARATSIIADGDPRELRDDSDDPRVHGFFNRSLAEAP